MAGFRHYGVLALVFGLAAAASARAQELPPNLLFEVRKPAVEALAARPVDRTEPVTDYILRTNIEGVGRTTGQVSVEFIPSAQRAAIDFLLHAQTTSQTVGYRGPVQLHSTNLSDIMARKRVWFDADGLFPEPARGANQTESTLDDITTRFRRPLADCLMRMAAERKYRRTHERALRITEEHVDQRVAPRLDQDAQPDLDSANRWYRERFRGPLAHHGIFADELHTSTTESAILLSARLGNNKSKPPPAIAASSDAALRLHESLLNEGARRLLSGKTYTGARFFDEFDDLLGPFRRRKKERPDEPELAITFAAERPAEFAFDKNEIRLTVHGTKFRSDDREYEAMNITAVYKIAPTRLGFLAVRQGELEIYPPDFVKGRDRLTSSQVALRKLLQRRLGDLFQDEFELDEVELPKELQKAGPLVPTQFEASHGWLLLGVRRGK